MRANDLDLVRDVLDHEVVDVDGVPCGVVDDLEMSVTEPGKASVGALLMGPGAWGPRLPPLFAFLVAAVFGRHVTRVPWNEVWKVGERIQLKRKAADLRLNGPERRLAVWLKWIPGNAKAD